MSRTYKNVNWVVGLEVNSETKHLGCARMQTGWLALKEILKWISRMCGNVNWVTDLERNSETNYLGCARM